MKINGVASFVVQMPPSLKQVLAGKPPNLTLVRKLWPAVLIRYHLKVAIRVE